jgi:hypothetical protein
VEHDPDARLGELAQGSQRTRGYRGVDLVEAVKQAGPVRPIQESAERTYEPGPLGEPRALGKVLLDGGAGLLITGPGGNQAGDHRIP